MKKILTVLFILILFTAKAQTLSNFSEGDLEAIAKAERRAHSRNFLKENSMAASLYDVKYYRCYWEVDPAVRFIKGTVTVHFKTMQPLFDSLVLNMSDSLQLNAVTFHGNPLTDLHHGNNLLVIRFPAVIPPGLVDSVSISYQGVPPLDEWGTFGVEQHAGVPMLWTLSEPYGAGTWWPCKDGLTDKADSVDLWIDCPSAYFASSNGKLVQTVQHAGRTLYKWKHRYPIATYLVCMGVTNYLQHAQKVPFMGDTLDQVSYYFPEDSSYVLSRIPVTVRLIQVFDSLFGIYPFQNEKYGQTQFGWGGGMEHQTNTFVYNFEFELLSHELAHQWFGDRVTCGSWSDIWLNEGFATYLSGLSYEHIYPDLFIQFRKSRITKITSQPGGSVFCDDTTSIDRIFDGRLSYAKGGMILHQLRRIMGDQAFLNAMNSYLYDPLLTYGFVRTADFRAHLELEYGSDLGWYFDQWYTGEGYPSYHVAWGQSGQTLQFTLSQTVSSPLVPFFRLPVPIQFKNTEHDTLLVFDNLWNGQSFEVQLPFTADSVIVDPHWELITKNNTVNAVPEQEIVPVISLNPNPASDHIIFRLGEPGVRTGARLKILGIDSRVINETDLPANSKEFTLDTGTFKPGMYFWQLETAGRILSGKFLIRQP